MRIVVCGYVRQVIRLEYDLRPLRIVRFQFPISMRSETVPRAKLLFPTGTAGRPTMEIAAENERVDSIHNEEDG